ncbi:MAG: hypothetical protein ACKVWV_04650 [Planctomycetota bacterium]
MRAALPFVLGLLGVSLAAVDARAGAVSAAQDDSEALAAINTDMRARERRALILAFEGRHAAALQEYLWCYDNGDRLVPGYAGVRRSFLLGYIARLAKVHPPALQALNDRRDAAASRLGSGSTSRDDVADVCAIDRTLEEKARTIELYEWLRSERPLPQSVRWTFANEIAEPLATAQRYADILEMIEEPQAYIEEQLQLFRSRVDALKASKNPREAEGAERFAARGVSKLAPVFEALAGKQRREDANRLAVLLCELARTENTYVVLVECATRAGDAVLARTIAERGFADLPFSSKGPLRVAFDRLPSAK